MLYGVRVTINLCFFFFFFFFFCFFFNAKKYKFFNAKKYKSQHEKMYSHEDVIHVSNNEIAQSMPTIRSDQLLHSSLYSTISNDSVSG